MLSNIDLFIKWKFIIGFVLDELYNAIRSFNEAIKIAFLIHIQCVAI